MNSPQKVFHVRRNYNRWVANETLEDYALRFTAHKARKWSSLKVALTALGSISFLALEAIGAVITLNYGFINSFFAILAVSSLIFLTAFPITYHAAKQGVDIDLLTRGAGFGYLGSTLTSLIYASFTFIFFALEAAIMALALELTLNIPLSLGYLFGTLLIIPIVTHGITQISRFQLATVPLWLILQVLAIATVMVNAEQIPGSWLAYTPSGSQPGFDLVAFGCASTVLFSLIAQVGEQVDFIRFLPQDKQHSKHWWLALISAGPGWIFLGAGKILFGSLLAVLALNAGINLEDASDPNHLYLLAFGTLGMTPNLTLALTGIFVIVSQLKINVTNAYAGSIAWSNFFSRLTLSHPGRVVWLIFNLAIALALTQLGIFSVLKEILGGYSIIAIAWIGTLVADLVISKPLKLRPQQMEFKRAYLYDINPVGIGSLLIASCIGFISYSGFFGEIPKALASYITLLTTLVITPLLSALTQGRFYLARQNHWENSQGSKQCRICEYPLETEDMAFCPAYNGYICSLCCTLDGRCNDLCKTNSTIGEQLLLVVRYITPRSWATHLNHRLVFFTSLFLMTGGVIAGILLFLYSQLISITGVKAESVSSLLVNLYFFLLVVSGIALWVFVLLHENRKLAQEETFKQTQLLIEEVDAHKQTYQALQDSKDMAEQANNAKSRYLTGLSHELRSPLNAIMGYAQLLEKDQSIPNNRRDGLAVIRRSSEHLADLMEGLLDISRIEAGKLELARDEVNIKNLLEQIADMFKVQAMVKGIDFRYHQLTALPVFVRTDEKRLRQILINLLSNAIKYTHQGSVIFKVSYRNQVATFSIEDTGIGIAPDDLQRIFAPFERIKKNGEPYVPGTGLGLTITHFLTDIMGGNVDVDSILGKGTSFKVKLWLTSVEPHSQSLAEDKAIYGYVGARQTVFVVDDEPSHRSLMHEMLSAIGFTVVQAPDGHTCLDMLKYSGQDTNIFLLDVSLPGINGWELAQQIKIQKPSAFILMISANASEILHIPSQLLTAQFAYLVKPVKLNDVLFHIQRSTGLVWIYESSTETEQNRTDDLIDKAMINIATNQPPLPIDVRNEMIRLAKIGYANGLLSLLDDLKQQPEGNHKLLLNLSEHAKHFRFRELIELLEKP
jgi:signal transduction histidine kinase/CheY-like chemotaxis protein